MAITKYKTKHLKTIWTIIKQTFTQWSNDDVSLMAAALAYFSVVSLAPLLVITVAVLSFFFSDATLKVIEQIGDLLGPTGHQTAIQVMSNAAQKEQGQIATIISLLVLMVGASVFFAKLQQTMNKIWSVELKPKKKILSFVKKRLIAILMVFSLAIFVLISVAVSTTLSLVENRLLPEYAFLSFLLDIIFSLLLLTLIFAAMFKRLPDLHIPWRTVLAGAFVTAILFNLGKFGLSFYFSKSTTASVYGAAGSLAAFLIWVFYSTQIIFFGAEFTQVLSRHFGPPVRPEENTIFLDPERNRRQID